VQNSSDASLSRPADSPGFGVAGIHCGDLGCRNALEREPIGQALLEPAAEALAATAGSSIDV